MQNKKNIIILLCIIFALFACSGNKHKETSREMDLSDLTSNIISKGPSKFLPSKEEAVETIIKLLSQTNLLLRTQQTKSNSQLIVSWDKKDSISGNFCIFELSNIGESKNKLCKQLAISDLALFLKNKNKVFNFSKDISIKNKNSFAYNSDKNGQVSNCMEATFVNKKKQSTIKLCHKILIASFNPQNLWDQNPVNTDKEQMYSYHEFKKESSNWFTPEIQKAKIDGIVMALKAMMLPDIVAMQELEYADGKSELLSTNSPLRKKLEEIGYHYFYLGEQEKDNPQAITLGAISRYPLTNSLLAFNINLPVFKNFSQKEKANAKWTTRDVQVLELNLLDNKVKIFNNHWRSQGCHSPENCDYSKRVRIANAELVKGEILETLKKNPRTDIIVLGDLNVSYHDNILSYIGGTKEISEVQKTKKELQLYNIWYELPPEKRWEVSYGGTYDTLSNILISSNLFDNHGLQYQAQSFNVIGQREDLKHIFMNVDGNPLRWQQLKFLPEDAPLEQKNGITKMLAQRNCSPGSSQRKCKIAYTKHSGIGISDHLPLVTEFSFIHAPQKEKAMTNVAAYNFSLEHKILNVAFETCDTSKENLLKNIPDIRTIDLKDKSNFHKCVKIQEPNNPLPLKTIGLYKTNYVDINGEKVFLSIVRSFDPRDTSEDSENSNEKDQAMKSGSNMCVARKILQGIGGKVSFIVGKLGYQNGLWTIFAADKNDIKLVDLPLSKQGVCL